MMRVCRGWVVAAGEGLSRVLSLFAAEMGGEKGGERREENLFEGR